ncbi:hypothetical protein ABZ943_40340, partial [Streptomyces rubiginosohelvolus]
MSESPRTPAGQWTGTVTHDGEVDDYTVTFQEDGSLVVVTQKSTGTGSWSVTGDGAFTFFLREEFNTDAASWTSPRRRCARRPRRPCAPTTGPCWSTSP